MRKDEERGGQSAPENIFKNREGDPKEFLRDAGGRAEKDYACASSEAGVRAGMGGNFEGGGGTLKGIEMIPQSRVRKILPYQGNRTNQKLQAPWGSFTQGTEFAKWECDLVNFTAKRPSPLLGEGANCLEGMRTF